MEPVQEHLTALPAEEVNEDMDTVLFQEVLHERIKGLTTEEATNVLHEDLDELQVWLAEPGNKSSRLHFFYGFLLIAADSAEELFEPAIVCSVGQLHISTPSGAKLSQYDGVWEGDFGGAHLLISPNDRASLDANIETFNVAVTNQNAQWSCSRTPVSFGAVKGLKFTMISNTLQYKDVHYTLEVPGGYCTANVMHAGVSWCEADLERWLASIRVKGTS